MQIIGAGSVSLRQERKGRRLYSNQLLNPTLGILNQEAVGGDLEWGESWKKCSGARPSTDSGLCFKRRITDCGLEGCP